MKLALRTAAQGSKYTIDYAYGINWISIVYPPHSYFRPYPTITCCGEWVVYVERVTNDSSFFVCESHNVSLVLFNT